MKTLLLDLEDTVIQPVLQGWSNWLPDTSGILKTRSLIKRWKPDRIWIFSFAIWDNDQREQFNRLTREGLERLIEAKINLVPTVEDILLACSSAQKVTNTDFQDLVQMWGKQLSVQLFVKGCHALHKNDVILLDDTVEDQDCFFHNEAVNLEIRNIFTLQ